MYSSRLNDFDVVKGLRTASCILVFQGFIVFVVLVGVLALDFGHCGRYCLQLEVIDCVQGIDPGSE